MVQEPMNISASSYLLKLSRRYQLIRWLESVCFSISASLFTFVGCNLVFPPTVSWLISGLTFLAVLLTRGTLLRLFHYTPDRLIHFLNSTYVELEESADLILVENERLTVLQQIQKLKAIDRFQELRGSVRFHNKLGWAFLSVLVGCLIATASTFIPPTLSLVSSASVNQNRPVSKRQVTVPEADKISVTITPPLYTGKNVVVSNDLHLQLPEGSTVHWAIHFTEPVQEAFFVFSGKDTMKLRLKNQNEWEMTKQFADPGFYQVGWTNNGGDYKNSDFFRIDILKDRSPQITIETPASVTELEWSKNLSVTLTTLLADDYGLTDAVIVATVAKGSGEAVKFREEKIHFELPDKIEGIHVRARRTLQLNKLGMLPGDELYFYVEATDNRQPLALVTRTETFFVTIKDTTRDMSALASEMGIDVMPEYFRSQRQIIIDSEKLLAEQKQKKVTPADFRKRSNDLATDQKALRLRYGQFMGEEQESLGPVHDENGHEGHEDVATQYGHVHDTQNEQNQVPENKTDQKTTEKTESKDDQLSKTQNGYDNAEFLQLSIRAKLRAALAMMWDAELHLRLADPAKSLPFQYRILKLLKEISNDSRVYVRRTGFDPPPIKEDRRLKGDLSDIKNSTTNNHSLKNNLFPAIQQTLPILEMLMHSDSLFLSASQKKLLQQAGNELAAAAIEQPTINLRSLALLRSLVENRVPISEKDVILFEIRKTFWRILPAQPNSPSQQPLTLHSLDRSFVKNLEEQVK